jgi:hypothetical protein
MIEIEMPEPPEQDLVLAPKQDHFRGVGLAPEAREPLRHRISVGGPVCRRIDAASADDAELRYFLKEEAAHSDFYLLHLTCTLRPAEDEPFMEALIELTLTRARNTAAGEGGHAGDGGDMEEPIAWSMQPDRLVDAVEITRTISLGPTLKFLGAGIDLTAGQERKTTRQSVFLEAMYELESTPSWGLYRTESVELRGLYRFHLVVRAAKGANVTGSTLVEAKVRRRRFGVVPYTAGLADIPQRLPFTLHGGAE